MEYFVRTELRFIGFE